MTRLWKGPELGGETCSHAIRHMRGELVAQALDGEEGGPVGISLLRNDSQGALDRCLGLRDRVGGLGLGVQGTLDCCLGLRDTGGRCGRTRRRWGRECE